MKKHLVLGVVILAALAALLPSSAKALTTVPYPCGIGYCDYVMIRVDGNICPPATCQFVQRLHENGQTAIVGNGGVGTYGARCASLIGITGFTCNNPPVTFSANAYMGVFDGWVSRRDVWARKPCAGGGYRFSAFSGFGDVTDTTAYYPNWVAVNITSSCRASSGY